MVKSFICGTGSFKHQIEEEDEPCSPCSTPRKQRKSNLCKSKDSKNNNPYSDLGLDKFSALLAELESKRQKIYTQVGSEGISFVRFSYSNTNDCKPIVVRVREKQQQEEEKNNIHMNKDIEPTAHNPEVDKPSTSGNELGDQKIMKKKKSFPWKLNMGMLRRPSFYLPAVIILILLFLAVFGRSFAILCTSLGWYLVPIINGTSSNFNNRPRKKKVYARRASEKKIVNDGLSSPKSVITGAMNDLSSPRCGHRRSF
ncbi:hypothetical protein CsSME_00035802 [Camellia sinensis var. sinensis]